MAEKVEMRKLPISFHGRLIEQLGSQTYQSPTASIAEFVANAWDADAKTVEIILPDSLNPTSEVVIKDTGTGMSFEECRDKYLNIGWNRRGDDPDAKSPGGRKVIGRKGIGKFAGFGIADTMKIETISENTGEKTEFEMCADELIKEEYITGGDDLKAEYLAPDNTRKRDHGTKITLKKLKLTRNLSKKEFAKSLARRFILQQSNADFKIYVNGDIIPEGIDSSKIQFTFPKDYRDGESPENLTIEDGWGKETIKVLGLDKEVKWRVFFFEEPIEDEELNGIAIFAKGKLAQKPFFFNASGGMGGQTGQVYMSGQVQADYVDSLPRDVLSPERQRIDWDYPETEPLLDWGQKRMKELLNKWAERRGEERARELEKKINRFSERLEKLPKSEANTVKRVLIKLGSIPSINSEKYKDVGEAVLTAWEGGRLADLLDQIDKNSNLSETDLLNLFLEAQVISALNVAEAIKTKLSALSKLKEMIKKEELENTVRDHIAENPWIINPKWDTFKKETSVKKIIEDAAHETKFDEYAGRVDLALGSGNQLLILEFMRPGLTLDWDHITRFERYIRKINTTLKANSGSQFKSPVYGYLVADRTEKKPDIIDKIDAMKEENMVVTEWDMLFRLALSSWKEYLKILAKRGENDERLKSLLNDIDV